MYIDTATIVLRYDLNCLDGTQRGRWCAEIEPCSRELTPVVGMNGNNQNDDLRRCY
jgi:hypothetical protein